MTNLIAAAGSRLLVAAAGLPDSNNHVAPPGADKVTTVVSWASWIACVACILGALFVAAMMALSAAGRTPHGGGHGAGLAWVLAGCIVIGASTGLIGALI